MSPRAPSEQKPSRSLRKQAWVRSTRATLAAVVLAAGALDGCSSSDSASTVQQGDEEDFTLGAAPLFAPPKGSAAKFPIVLVAGFSAVPTNPIWAFNGVAAALRADGHIVFEDNVPPFGSPLARATALGDQVKALLAKSGASKVHLIAHSMGGIDARVLISELGFGDRVASLTTVVTPHRGSLVADVYLKLVPGDADKAANAIAHLVERSLSDLSTDADLRAAFSGISESKSAAFNAAHPDDPRVFYQSWAGVSNVLCLPHPDLAREDRECEGKLLRHRFRYDCMDPLLVPISPIVAHGTELRPNDGLVTVVSAKWTNFRGCIPADHLDDVGQINDRGVNTRTGFDHVAYYRTMAFELAAREGCFAKASSPSLDCTLLLSWTRERMVIDSNGRKDAQRFIAQNRAASFHYAVSERFEAGIVLRGSEVKSLREGGAQLTDAYATVDNGEVWLRQMHIASFFAARAFPHAERGARKLLLHAKEILHLERAVSREGHALLPLALYFKEGRVKVTLGLGRGRKAHDKRAVLAAKTEEREALEAVRARRDGRS